MNVKRAALTEYLEADDAVIIRVDGRSCDVPEEHRQPALALRLGWDMTPPIHLELGERDLQATLMFGGTEHRCVIPWGALYAIALEHGPETLCYWPSSAPREGVAPAPPPVRRGFLKSVS